MDLRICESDKTNSQENEEEQDNEEKEKGNSRSDEEEQSECENDAKIVDDDDNTSKEAEDIKKEIEKKITKIGHERNKKLRHVRQKKNGNRIIKKHDSHGMKRQRIKRRTIEVDSKRAQHFNHREKLHARKDRRNVRQVHRKRTMKSLGKRETVHTTAKPQAGMEKTNIYNEYLIKLLEQYSDYVSKVARVIAREQDTEISQERLDEDVQDMIKFQLKLIQIVPTYETYNGSLQLELTLKDFQKWYNENNPKTPKSKINWVNKIKTLFDEANVPVDDDLNLDISSRYIKDLISLLDETSNRTIVNYIHWNFISTIIQTTTREMVELYDSWEQASKAANPKSRFDRCINSEGIKEILGYEFVKKYLSDDMIKIASNMSNDIRKEVEYLIKESDWLDNETMDFLLAKIRNMKGIYMGHPVRYKNTTIIQEYYKGLVISSSHYENVIRYSKYTKQKNLQKFSKDEEIFRNDHELHPYDVQAFYMYNKNTLAVSTAALMSPFLSFDRPRFTNLGIIGFIIAHEVNHGIDDIGHQYDKDGDYQEWNSSMANAYNRKKDCFVNQFNNYPIDKNTNEKIKNYGEQMTSDNIADSMALQAIFKAYQRKEKEIPDTILPGTEDFTNNQLLFISFANLWCQVFDPSKTLIIANEDSHSMNRLRLIGSVSNSDDFAKAYNCPVGSPMNPEKKCNIWK